MCGIVGIYSQQDVASELLDSLIHLQHRGQDAAGILTCNQRFYTHQGLGLVREVFNQEKIQGLKGHMGIGHTRYPTAGSSTPNDIQPLWIGSPRGLALAHNGNLFNYQEVADEILRQHRHLNSTMDSEVILLVLAEKLAVSAYDSEEEVFFELLCSAVQHIFDTIEGAYSIVSVAIDKGLIAFRDPHGVRPLVWGSRDNESGSKDIIFASENTPFYALGFHDEGDIKPGEVAFVSTSGKLYRRVLQQKEYRPCVFEYVYFARPDATLNGVNVYRSRLRMGQNLSKQWLSKYPHIIPDVVIPVPFTSNTAALSFAHGIGVRYSEGLYKNPFIGRTFIMPNVTARARSIGYKLTPQRTEIHNKSVLVLDDSIVRGATSREIVKMLRQQGAKNIYMVSASPPIKHPCFRGIDIPTHEELIAHNMTEDEIAAYIGVDILMYLSLDNLVEAVTRRGKHNIVKPCMSCMDGDYFCDTLTMKNMLKLAKQRQLDKKTH